MATPLFRPTIEEAFGQFLTDQFPLVTRTMHDQYQDTLEYFHQFLEQDGGETLPEPLKAQWKEASARGEKFLKTFHTPQILPAVPEFYKDLSYQQSLLPPGFLTTAEKTLRLLGRWLLAQELGTEKDYLEALAAFPHYAAMLEPAELLSSLLFDHAHDEPPMGKIFEEVKGYVEIKRVQKGALILLPVVENHLSPFVRVPNDASAIAVAGWWIDAHLVQSAQGWHFVEVGAILP